MWFMHVLQYTYSLCVKRVVPVAVLFPQDERPVQVTCVISHAYTPGVLSMACMRGLMQAEN